MSEPDTMDTVIHGALIEQVETECVYWSGHIHWFHIYHIIEPYKMKTIDYACRLVLYVLVEKSISSYKRTVDSSSSVYFGSGYQLYHKLYMFVW